MLLSLLIAGIAGGLLFGILDGLVHANPLARRLLAAWQPIARDSLNVPAGLAVNLLWSFAMAGIYLVLAPALPGPAGLVKGLAYGGLVWFFRVAMPVASNWLMFKLPGSTLVYTLAAGLGEMLALGLFYGLVLPA